VYLFGGDRDGIRQLQRGVMRSARVEMHVDQELQLFDDARGFEKSKLHMLQRLLSMFGRIVRRLLFVRRPLSSERRTERQFVGAQFGPITQAGGRSVEPVRIDHDQRADGHG